MASICASEIKLFYSVICAYLDSLDSAKKILSILYVFSHILRSQGTGDILESSKSYDDHKSDDTIWSITQESSIMLLEVSFTLLEASLMTNIEWA